MVNNTRLSPPRQTAVPLNDRLPADGNVQANAASFRIDLAHWLAFACSVENMPNKIPEASSNLSVLIVVKGGVNEVNRREVVTKIILNLDSSSRGRGPRGSGDRILLQ